MTNFRERPVCRTFIESLCKEYDCNLKELWYLSGEKFSLSTGLYMQLRKMLKEKGIKVE